MPTQNPTIRRVERVKTPQIRTVEIHPNLAILMEEIKATYGMDDSDVVNAALSELIDRLRGNGQ